ncbi:phage tail tube protein [Microbispora sp. CA-102843]|uniref:phage tail tube protein n=1 Tax=Microbispora sp. CA-102843 TaxID=3239952 RepID=UPI003D93DEFF
MAKRRINARDMIVEVEDDTADTWLRVENLQNITVNPGENEETADVTDNDSEGSYEQEVMQRGASLALEGLLMKDDSTGALPPGRARVEEMCGEDKLGYDSLGRVRFRHPMDTQWRIWPCTFSLGEQGGATNDKSSWSATITKSGKTTTAAVATGGGGGV